MSAQPKTLLWLCFHCGAHAPEPFDLCPKCGTWHSSTPSSEAHDERGPVARPNAPTLREMRTHAPIMFSRHPGEATNHWTLATGGGWVKGASYLVWSKGGLGKSREMLKECARLGGAFVSIEMPLGLVLPVATEIGALDAHAIDAFGKTPAEAWAEINKAAHFFSFVVADSVTAIGDRDTCSYMRRLRPLTTATIVYIGQATKGGEHAGPAQLAHEVDCEIVVRPRSLRTNKNRMGPRGSFPRV